ncbi:murein L,D-transpeptidase catalytic domain family protein [Rhodanobacter umsongensis]|uniref:Murein L,D-transpeptidase catalytic domain family protein n=1 Tax=Rhodanobacter umsongensis TaxID=633153 RepID=A0ABW0JG69_9GAMM
MLLVPAAAGASTTSPEKLVQALSRAAPAANPKVLALATQALACVQRRMPGQTTLSVIDYSLPSTKPRLWVFDLAQQPRLLFEEWVAHGRNSGDNLANRFSNTPGSLMSSLGTFVTDGTYTGHNGYSLRLKGIDGNFNDQAESRAIVVHGASYVSPAFAHSQGRLGRSYGCPAVRAAVSHKLIDAIRERSVVFAYYPDPRWLSGSRLLGDCGGNQPMASR